MLHWRLILGSVFIAALVGLFWLDATLAQPGIILFFFAVSLTVMASGEYIRLTQFTGFHSRAISVYGGSLLVVLLSGVPYFWPLDLFHTPFAPLGWAYLTWMIVCLLAVIIEIAAYRDGKNNVLDLGLTVLGIFYIGLLMSILVQLRFVGGELWKGLPLVALLITVKFGDIGAYAVGRTLGRNRAVPQLSPGKTVEGFIGGLAFSVGGAFLACRFLPVWLHLSVEPFSWWQAIFFGLLVGTAGILGDLAESLIKRVAKQKDSSAWLPGFGGILDLMDSLLFAGPVALIFWILLLGP